MATRSRTLLFLQYRNSFARTTQKSAPVGPDTSDKASLLANGEGFVVEMSVLPPKWVDIVEEVEERMDAIKRKLTDLQQLHKKSLLPGFDDRRAEELSIKNLTQDITDGLTDDQLAVIESNEAAITQREKEINHIAKSIHTLAEIFRDMQTMVIDQGTMLDRIDYNIEQTALYTEEAVVELNKVRRLLYVFTSEDTTRTEVPRQGAKYQKSTRTKLFIILLSILVLIMLVVLIFKPRKSSQSSTTPSGQTGTNKLL
ncbi:hypothetical protein HDU93_006709 [Gonapodya sp. JEL0774]|nr:hypothetical protein HDU93_006709 [Gonapodya sp. JEL0774]